MIHCFDWRVSEFFEPSHPWTRWPISTSKVIKIFSKNEKNETSQIDLLFFHYREIDAGESSAKNCLNYAKIIIFVSVQLAQLWPFNIQITRIEI